ncbi:MAG: methionine--tRNA ligase [Desulfobacteraceae bacterium]
MNEISDNPFYITTPIYYVNAKPHLGHAYTTIAADVARRFHRLKGVPTYFLTGTDEHGDKITEAAKNENTSPQEYTDKISSLFKDLWPQLNITNDDFIRTTEPRHKAVVARVLQEIYDKGEIYYSEYEGLYCVGCERFYQERELVDGLCPDHKKEPKRIKESNYFFKMSAYQDWLIDHINQNPDFIRPKQYRTEVLSFLKDPLEDLCISRPKSRLTWGITLPFDENYVTYVWFDALLNYVSALGYPDGEKYKTFWPHAQHIIAKDILKTHAIYWPTIMKAAGIPLFKSLNVHGFWNMGESKMSKSLGNVANPLSLKEKYGVDAYRFFLIRDMVFGLDSNFSEEAIVQRINSDLANDLGNLFSRVIAMSLKYFGGAVPEWDDSEETKHGLSLQCDAEEAVHDYCESMEIFAFHKGLAALFKLIGRMNKYVDETAPWDLAKDEANTARLKTVMYNLLEGLRVVAGLISPVMPETSKTMLRHLGFDEQSLDINLQDLNNWKSLKPGAPLTKAKALFPRIVETKEAKTPETTAPVEPVSSLSTPLKPEISFDDFSRLDLRTAIVIKAEAIPKAEKLLKVTVDMGEGHKRTLVAGISKSYSPEELVGKQVIIVANLKPAKLMGQVSQGMILAATDNQGLSVATFDRPFEPGSQVK